MSQFPLYPYVPVPICTSTHMSLYPYIMYPYVPIPIHPVPICPYTHMSLYPCIPVLMCHTPKCPVPICLTPMSWCRLEPLSGPCSSPQPQEPRSPAKDMPVYPAGLGNWECVKTTSLVFLLRGKSSISSVTASLRLLLASLHKIHQYKFRLLLCVLPKTFPKMCENLLLEHFQRCA